MEPKKGMQKMSLEGKTPEEVKEIKAKQHKGFLMHNLIEMNILPKHVKITCPSEDVICSPLITDEGTWSHDFVSCKTWIKFHFPRPISVRGYSITFGDTEDQDPLVWEIRCKDNMGMIDSMDPHKGRAEQHGIKPDFVPKRGEEKVFPLKDMVWTNEVHLNFAKKRGEGNKIQIARVKFYC